jgi:hypothetical protein
MGSQDCGDVQERAGGRGDRDAVVQRHLVGRHGRLVDADSRPRPHAASDGHLDQIAPPDAPPGGRRSVAEHRSVHRQHGGEPDAVAAEERVADGVHAAVHCVQPPGLEAVADGPTTEAEVDELAAGDDAVLGRGEGRDRAVHRTRPTLCPDDGPNVDFARHGAIVAGEV